MLELKTPVTQLEVLFAGREGSADQQLLAVSDEAGTLFIYDPLFPEEPMLSLPQTMRLPPGGPGPQVRFQERTGGKVTHVDLRTAREQFRAEMQSRPPKVQDEVGPLAPPSTAFEPMPLPSPKSAAVSMTVPPLPTAPALEAAPTLPTLKPVELATPSHEVLRPPPIDTTPMKPMSADGLLASHLDKNPGLETALATFSALKTRRDEINDMLDRARQELNAWRDANDGFDSMGRLIAGAGKTIANLAHLRAPFKDVGATISEPELLSEAPQRARLRELGAQLAGIEQAMANVAAGRPLMNGIEGKVDFMLKELALAQRGEAKSPQDVVHHRLGLLKQAAEGIDTWQASELYQATARALLWWSSSTGESVHRLSSGEASLSSVINGLIAAGVLDLGGRLVLSNRELGDAMKAISKLQERTDLPESIKKTLEALTPGAIGAEARRLDALFAQPELAGYGAATQELQDTLPKLDAQLEDGWLEWAGKIGLKIVDSPETWAMLAVAAATVGMATPALMGAAGVGAVSAMDVAVAMRMGTLSRADLGRFATTAAVNGVVFHTGMNAFNVVRGKSERATWGVGDYLTSIVLFEALGGVQANALKRQLLAEAPKSMVEKLGRQARTLGEEVGALTAVALGSQLVRTGELHGAMEMLVSNLELVLILRLLHGAGAIPGSKRNDALARLDRDEAALRKSIEELQTMSENDPAFAAKLESAYQMQRAVFEQLQALNDAAQTIGAAREVVAPDLARLPPQTSLAMPAGVPAVQRSSLLGYLQEQKWYHGGDRPVERVELLDVRAVEVKDAGEFKYVLANVKVEYAEGAPEYVLATLKVSPDGRVSNALVDEAFSIAVMPLVSGGPDAAAQKGNVNTDRTLREKFSLKSGALLALAQDPALPTAARVEYLQRLGEVAGLEALPALETIARTASVRQVRRSARAAMRSISNGSKLSIVFAAMEAKPYVGGGGLGNVMMEKPRALAALGHDVTVIIPRHASIDRTKLTEIKGDDGNRFRGEVRGTDYTEPFQLLTETVDGVRYVFVENDKFFSANRDGVYADKSQRAYGDNLERFDFFGQSLGPAVRKLYPKGPPDVLDLSDAHLGPGAHYTKRDPYFSDTAITFGLHNNGRDYQGIYGMDARHRVKFGEENLFYPTGPAELYGDINLLKLGVTSADGTYAVSRGWLQEILTPEGGQKLDGVFRELATQERIFGRLNGINREQWDPAKDPYLSHPYTAGDTVGKAKAKAALQEELGLPVDPKAPLFGMVARLDPQKGYDDVVKLVERSLEQNQRAQFVIHGEGSPDYASQLARLAKEHPDRVSFDSGPNGTGTFSTEKEHRILAGSDFLMMPSKFEPSGLTQLYALRYGTVPFVRATGGLEESIQQFEPAQGTGNGFKFKANPERAFDEAVALFEQGGKPWSQLVENAAKADFGWESTAALEQLAIYRTLIDRKRNGSDVVSARTLERTEQALGGRNSEPSEHSFKWPEFELDGSASARSVVAPAPSVVPIAVDDDTPND